MPADTAAPSMPPSPAGPAAPAATVPVAPAITRQEGRRFLADGLAALAQGLPSNGPGPVDSRASGDVSSPVTATAAAAPPPSTAPASAASAPSAPSSEPPAPVMPAAAPASSPADAPPVTGPAKGQEAPATAAAAPPPPVPAPVPADTRVDVQDPLAGYHTPELDALYRADALLRRTVARIAGNPALSEGQRAEQIATKISQARDRVAAHRQQQAGEEQLWEQGRYEELAARRAATKDSAEAAHQQAQAISRLLAVALDADEADPEFQQAGPHEGESAEVGLQRFVDYLTSKSPVVAARIARVVAETQAAHGTASAQLQAAHEQELAALRMAHQQEVAAVRAELEAERVAAVEEAKAQARGGFFPPAARVSVPADAAAGPFVPPTLRDARGLLAAGLRLHDQAAQERPPS